MTSTHLILYSMREQLSVKEEANSQNCGVASVDEDTNEKSN